MRIVLFNAISARFSQMSNKAFIDLPVSVFHVIKIARDISIYCRCQLPSSRNDMTLPVKMRVLLNLKTFEIGKVIFYMNFSSCSIRGVSVHQKKVERKK